MPKGTEDDEPPHKRQRRSSFDIPTTNIRSLTTRASISPPRRESAGTIKAPGFSVGTAASSARTSKTTAQSTSVVVSPIQLTWIQDLPDSLNVDAITLNDILGDPMISECWEFNYLHDIEFLMEAFDPDVRSLVDVHVIHGFWRHEDSPGVKLRAEASKYPNVTAHTAYMPEAYGTHHTKMMVLFRHDDTAQVVIHTANLIRQDWRNLSQAVWRSPSLPLINGSTSSPIHGSQALGSGEKFKTDFLNYLRSYNVKRPVCTPLVDKLIKYDFSSIRGVLVGSIPGRHPIDSERDTLWGWPAMKNALQAVPSQDCGEIVAQISSIATLGVTDAWLVKTLFKALDSSSNAAKLPMHKIVFPTADEIRRSLDGYNAGASIHIKTLNAQHQKQLQYLKPLLHHWAGDGEQHALNPAPTYSAGRKRAAPHIKTYIRYSSDLATLSWALVTSANISKQAWGEAVNSAGDVRIQSYELGVLLWPGLWGDDAEMVPVFGKDLPEAKKDTKVVGIRMPYDLPLTKYSREDDPWCATGSYNEPDWKGQVYNAGGG